MDMPHTPKGLQRFLGSVNFYRRYLPGYAKVVAPLYAVSTSKPETKPSTWHPEIILAFEKAKCAISKCTSLVHPNPNLSTSIATDASTNGLGAVLQQMQDQQWRPVAFFSKGLNIAQKKYSPFDLELLAVYEAVKHFKILSLNSSEFEK